jgi:putative transcriptional regulator
LTICFDYVNCILQNMQEYISNEVNTLRNKKGVTQEELAEKLQVSRQTIIAIEKGNYTPSVLLALKIASFFKLPVENIFKISYEK